MKRYILFTQEELTDMLNGREIDHDISEVKAGEKLYFMCKEHFLDKCETDEVTVIPDEFVVKRLIFKTKRDAKEALSIINHTIAYYGIATVADMYDIVDYESRPDDSDYGWVSTGSAEIIKVENGWELKMPRALPIRW
jgi:hypothetical protein